MDISVTISGIPLLTKWYMGSLFVTAFTLTYLSPQIVTYLILDYHLAFKQFQLWRLVTNVFVIGGFSMNFLFFLYFIFSTFQSYESAAIKTKRYAEFISMLVYLLIVDHFVNLVSHYVFGFKLSFTLCQQIIFGMLYIDSKRNPFQPIILFIFKIQNAYLPIAYLILNIVTGGQVLESILGIIVGHIYYVLKDIVPIHKQINVFPTPKFLVDFIERKMSETNSRNRASSSNFSTIQNQNSSGTFGNRTTGNEGNNNSFRRDNTDGNGNRGFQAFSGTGHTLG